MANLKFKYELISAEWVTISMEALEPIKGWYINAEWSGTMRDAIVGIMVL